MSETLTYKVQKYSDEYKNIFKGVYNDFKKRAFSEYKFELEPLEYEDFTVSVKEGLIDCLILFEDEIPTAFMVYTTEISEALELNIIHCLGEEDLNAKRKLLMDNFMSENKEIMKEKVVTYPMLGSQEAFTPEITNYDFKLIGLAVERFNFDNIKSIEIFKRYTQSELPEGYEITDWDAKYCDEIINVINTSFKNTSDALFDPRFLSKEGSTDILNKIVAGVYGKFLPDCTSVLLYKKKPVGLCFTNITAGRIANIPLIGMNKEHCSKGLGEALLYNSMTKLFAIYGDALSEVNASTETDNYPALKMYRRLGFKEDYYYPQAYRPVG